MNVNNNNRKENENDKSKTTKNFDAILSDIRNNGTTA